MPLRQPLHQREAEACAHGAATSAVAAHERLLQAFYVGFCDALSRVEHINLGNRAVAS